MFHTACSPQFLVIPPQITFKNKKIASKALLSQGKQVTLLFLIHSACCYFIKVGNPDDQKILAFSTSTLMLSKHLFAFHELL